MNNSRRTTLRCPYCAQPRPRGQAACHAHTDLPAIDLELRGDKYPGGVQSAPEVA